SSSTGTGSSSCRSTPRPRAPCTTRRCRRTCSSRRSSARCAGRSSARCASPRTSASWRRRNPHPSSGEPEATFFLDTPAPARDHAPMRRRYSLAARKAAMYRFTSPLSFRHRLSRLTLAVVLTAIAAASLVWPDISFSRADTASEAAVALDEKVIDEAKSNSEIMANLTHLSDVIGPRLTGSAALKRANEWTAEKMKSYGLANVRLEPWTIPVGWERGAAYARVVEPPNGRSLILASMGWSPGTKGKV